MAARVAAEWGVTDMKASSIQGGGGRGDDVMASMCACRITALHPPSHAPAGSECMAGRGASSMQQQPHRQRETASISPKKLGQERQGDMRLELRSRSCSINVYDNELVGGFDGAVAMMLVNLRLYECESARSSGGPVCSQCMSLRTIVVTSRPLQNVCQWEIAFSFALGSARAGPRAFRSWVQHCD